MREKLGVVVCVLFVLYGSCLGRFIVEKNSLKVTSPDSLKGVHESAIGNFGVPQYGGTMVGSVFYPKSNQKGCGSFDDVDGSLKKKPGGIPIFLLADRGGKILSFSQLFVGLLSGFLITYFICFGSLICQFVLFADCMCV